jgi:hypothetical protein
MFTALTASASASEREMLDKKGGTLLRDVAKEPKGLPDSLEFVNNGTVKVSMAGIGTVECTEIALGATVANNNGTSGLKLAMPFGVFEGDNCALAGIGKVPSNFVTLANGPVGNPANGHVTSVTITGGAAPFTATLHDLKFSQNIGGKFCTFDFNLVEGKMTNTEAGFVEEKPPNLEAKFDKVKSKASGEVGCPAEAEVTADFFLKTPSTTTDTAWVQ